MSKSSIQYGGIEAFAPWDIFWSGGIETFWSKIYNDFEPYQDFMYIFYAKLF